MGVSWLVKYTLTVQLSDLSRLLEENTYTHLVCTSDAKQTPASDSVIAPVTPLTVSACMEQANDRPESL